VSLPPRREALTLHVAAESLYHLYVEGRPTARGPVRGTESVNFYDTVTLELPPGPSDLWLAVAVYCPNVHSYKYHPACPAVWLSSDCNAIASDTTWEVATSPAFPPAPPLYTPQIGPIEWKDARREPLDWSTGGGESLDWRPASDLSAHEGIARKQLRPRDVPALPTRRIRPARVLRTARVPAAANRAIADLARHLSTEPHTPLLDPPNVARLCEPDGPPLVVAPPADGGGVTCILDFEAAVNGGLEIDLDAPSGTIVEIGYQEALSEGRLQLDFESYCFADRYTLREGRQITGTDFAERGFRMAQLVLRNFDRPVRVYGVAGIDRRYPYAAQGNFGADDARWQQLWSVCDETLRACTTDTLLDCPWRENALWVNDLLVEAPTTMQAFGDPTVLRRSLRLAATQVRPDGLFPTVVPYGHLEGMSVLHNRDRLTLTAGNLTLPLVLEDYLLYSGDRDTVEALSAMMPAMLDCFASWEDAHGRCVPPARIWNFIDWSYLVDMDGRACCTLEWLRVLAHDALARVINHLDPTADASSWTRKADAIARRIDRHDWHEPQGVYREGLDDPAGRPLVTQLSQALAILSGRLSAPRRDTLAFMLMQNEGLAPELFMQHFVQRAMVQCGLAEAARQRLAQYWLPILDTGSPTIWEMGVHQKGKAMFAGAGSLCHGFSTTPIDFMQRAVLGVVPTAPGFARCRFHPQDAGFREVRGRVPTPHGLIEVDLQTARASEDDPVLFDVELHVPPGMVVDRPGQEPLAAGSHRFTYPASRRDATASNRPVAIG
jgi:hypothetical protein